MSSEIASMPEPVFAEECRRWDEVILQHFVFEVPRGDPVFLSIHEEALNRLGQKWERTSDHFLALVRRRWVRLIERNGKKPRQEVNVRLWQLRRPADTQGYVTFLAAMVLAAHWMQTEVREATGLGSSSILIDEKNYFKRLREVLGLELEDEQVRPRGLREYEDAEVWGQWTDWLEERGWQATARPGRGSRRYISYPLSQTLLRDGDRGWLAKRFWEEVRHGSLSRTYDPETLLGWMYAHRSRFPRTRLWQILDNSDQQLRYEATVGAVFEVYSSEDWDSELAEDDSERVERRIRRLTGGLYREEDPFTGDVAYSIYLRQPKGKDGTALTVSLQGVELTLRPERPGWFMPLPWGALPPAKSLTLSVVTVDSEIRQIIFPDRDFWVLVGDPRAGGTGAFASWDLPPVPEQPFILLCRPCLSGLLAALHSDQLLDWEEKPVDLADGTWLEYRGCRVHLARWRLRANDLTSMEQSLVKKIRPTPGGAIFLEGGLPAPDRQAGWMQEYLPLVMVKAPLGFADVSVLNLQTREPEVVEHVRANEPLELPALSPGFYRVEAALVEEPRSDNHRHVLPSVVLSVRSWDSLECAALASEPE